MTPTGTSQGVTILDDSRVADVYFNNEERKIMRALQRIFGWMERSLKIEGRGRRGSVGNKNARVTEVMMSLLCMLNATCTLMYRPPTACTQSRILNHQSPTYLLS